MAVLPRSSRAAYLRVAHMYMLISIPTDTSTIFGAFQAILALPLIPDELKGGDKRSPVESFAGNQIYDFTAMAGGTSHPILLVRLDGSTGPCATASRADDVARSCSEVVGSRHLVAEERSGVRGAERAANLRLFRVIQELPAWP
jgi:hypothetical protein